MPKLINNLPILNRMLSHWAQVERTTTNTLSLPDGTTRAEVQELATRIQSVEAELLTGRNVLSAAQGARDQARKTAHPAAKQARRSLRGLAKNVPEVLGLPQVPPLTSAPAVLIAALDDIADVWARINGLPQASVPAVHLPLRVPLLEGETVVPLALAQFEAQITTLRTAAQALTEAEDAVTVGIGTRDGLHERAAERVKSYATVARSVLPEGHPLLKTVPKLTGA
jgi:hypothetical protein